MCGLFGFVGQLRDRDTFVDLALKAAGRGPHSHGWSAVYADRVVRTDRYLGPLRKNVGRLQDALELDPRALIGHARLATTGGISYSRIEDAQPVVVGPVCVAHNGNADFGTRNPKTVSGNDSERIALLMAEHIDGNPPGDALKMTLGLLPSRAPYAVLALCGAECVLASRRGLPLYRLDRDDAIVIASIEFPGSRLLAEREVAEVAVPPIPAAEGRCRARRRIP